MTNLNLAVSLIAKPGQEVAMRSALEALVPLSLSDDGCLGYILHRDHEKPQHFFLYETWRDKAAWQAHMETPHLKTFGETSGAYTESWTLHQLERM
jgi:quinol monooxygenase YgiN